MGTPLMEWGVDGGTTKWNFCNVDKHLIKESVTRWQLLMRMMYGS